MPGNGSPARPAARSGRHIGPARRDRYLVHVDSREPADITRKSAVAEYSRANFLIIYPKPTLGLLSTRPSRGYLLFFRRPRELCKSLLLSCSERCNLLLSPSPSKKPCSPARYFPGARAASLLFSGARRWPPAPSCAPPPSLRFRDVSFCHSFHICPKRPR